MGDFHEAIEMVHCRATIQVQATQPPDLCPRPLNLLIFQITEIIGFGGLLLACVYGLRMSSWTTSSSNNSNNYYYQHHVSPGAPAWVETCPKRVESKGILLFLTSWLEADGVVRYLRLPCVPILLWPLLAFLICASVLQFCESFWDNSTAKRCKMITTAQMSKSEIAKSSFAET
jgi:hypothetical protein